MPGGVEADSFVSGFADISKLKTEKGLALQDVILGIYDFVATVEFKPQARVYLLDQLAQVECVLLITFRDISRALADDC